ncbi:MAG TPA: family 78 glycoside hydrolase catalytic domain [Acidimicrobiales bacterium]|nr:family 78 glycoside hydrolase catalytic domain [Acidimicrobiales bacterium]
MTVLPVNVRFEHHPTGFGIGTRAPRISWELAGDDDVFGPTAYEVELSGRSGANPVPNADVPNADGPNADGPNTDGPVTSGAITGGEQVLVPWPFAPLRSRERATVRVRVASGDIWTGWSEPASVEAGLLDVSDWTGSFITPKEAGAIGSPAPLVRGEFKVNGAVVSARLYTTALGIYEATLNGTPVGDEVLAPGWTTYDKRLCYQTFDVTALLVEGANTLQAMLGNGWYRGQLTWLKRRAVYGDRLAYLAQLEVTYSDGSAARFVTDESWRAADSAVLQDDLYDGQTTDLGREASGPWTPVEKVQRDLATLVAPQGPPVRRLMTLPALELLTSPSGKSLVDFGQNLVGWVRLTVHGAAPGQEVTVRHAEVLEHGELGTRPLRGAKATDKYILKGAPDEVLEPSLTFHGFRYAEVEGLEGLEVEQVEAVVVGNDLVRTGWFESSSTDLNRLHENVVWGMRGNFLSIPTDCPQRDERLGWTGDIQVFTPAATSLFDCAGFLSSWLGDLAAEQGPDGSVPLVVPNVLGPGPAIAVWGDAACVVPWVLYERFGDEGILATQWESMRGWVDYMASHAGDGLLWSGQFQLGDWLDPTAPPDNPAAAKADPDVIATACFASSAEIVSRAAGVLGKAEAAERYGSLASGARQAFADNYVTPSGRVLSDAQTVYALAIAWSLLPGESQRAGAGRRLADLVRLSGHRISTGFAGTPFVLDALVGTGHVDTAYRLLFQHDVPSWLYAVSMGATTVWERWDSMLPDGSINPGEMTSFNHYAFGAVADFLHRVVAGLAPGEPGYRSILVKPTPGRALSSARARQVTPYGEAEVGWRREAGRFILEVRVPLATTARVFLPGRDDPEAVGAGEHKWEIEDPVGKEAPLPSSPTVLDLLAHEAAWLEFSGILAGASAKALDGRPVSDLLVRFADTRVAQLLEGPMGLGMRQLPDETRGQLEAVVARFSG